MKLIIVALLVAISYAQTAGECSDFVGYRVKYVNQVFDTAGPAVTTTGIWTTYQYGDHESCVGQCDAETTCEGFYHFNWRCNLYSAINGYNVAMDKADTVTFVQDDTCKGEADTSEGSSCIDGYEIVLEEGLGFAAATEESIDSADTLDECKNSCNENDDCWGYFMYTSGSFQYCQNYIETTAGGDRNTVTNGGSSVYADNTAVYAKCTISEDESGGTSASSHGDPIIWTFNNECYDLSKDGFYLASGHPDWWHGVYVAVYNDFIREIQIRDEGDNILLSVSNLNEVTGTWQYGFKHLTKQCHDFSWSECEFTYDQFHFDAQFFKYVVHIHFHDYVDPALRDGERGLHLDVYPLLYDAQKAKFNPLEFDGVYFKNPYPEELGYCPVNSARRT